jgi:hypothetical protein
LPSDEPSNRQSVNTGLRSNCTKLAPTLVGCGRACKPLQTTKGSTAVSCPMTQAYQASWTTSMLASRQITLKHAWENQHPDGMHLCLVWKSLPGMETARHKALQRVVHTAQYITGAKLPAILDLYTAHCQRKALKMVKDSKPP